MMLTVLLVVTANLAYEQILRIIFKLYMLSLYQQTYQRLRLPVFDLNQNQKKKIDIIIHLRSLLIYFHCKSYYFMKLTIYNRYETHNL